MSDFEPEAVASRLNCNQRNVVLGIGDEPTLFGCGEGVALRLAVANSRRPALTFVHRDQGEYPLFTLTADGLAVQRVLA